ncbi:MAG: dienelactone hydrolase family protein [Acidobacteria bacterium]|nr:dienelactone hydrolase family protein [Acidobacteriota bacterium]
MKLIILASIVLLAQLSALASTPEEVSYQSGPDTVKAVLYRPSGEGPFPALIVIHEWWGLNDWVKEQATKLSDQGYVALAVDLYRGHVASDPGEAHELMRGMPEDRAKRDLDAAFHYLASQAYVKKNKIGAIGWCMGGGYSLDVALEEPQLAADVIHYGHLATDEAALKKINAPILGIFGGQDRGIQPADVRKFEAQMKQLGKSIAITIYPNAGHAFENPNNKDGYRAEDARDAWTKTVNFLATTLK